MQCTTATAESVGQLSISIRCRIFCVKCNEYTSKETKFNISDDPNWQIIRDWIIRVLKYKQNVIYCSNSFYCNVCNDNKDNDLDISSKRPSWLCLKSCIDTAWFWESGSYFGHKARRVKFTVIFAKNAEYPSRKWAVRWKVAVTWWVA